MRYLIIGAGIAAAAAIKAIRECAPAGPAANITVITAEQPGFYFRPMLPLLVEGSRNADELFFPPDFFDTAGLNIIKDRAVRLDPEQKTIHLESGTAHVYDRLLIATGSRAVLPDIDGLSEAGNLHSLQTMGDALRLRDACTGAHTGVVLGGGLAGLKAALALKNRGLAITVIEQQKQLLFPRLDGQAAAMVTARLAEAGITAITGETVLKIRPQGLALSSGREITADLIVAATGVRPAIDWLQGSGLKLGRAITTDEYMRTSLADVYAAGDAAEAIDLVEGRPVVSALWSNAVAMGRTAGASMAGGKKKFHGCLAVMNATELAGLAMVTVGSVSNDRTDQESHVSATTGTYRKLLFRNDRLTGAIFLGDIRRAGLYTNLIKTGRPLGRLKEKAINDTLQAVDLLQGGRAQA